MAPQAQPQVFFLFSGLNIKFTHIRHNRVCKNLVLYIKLYGFFGMCWMKLILRLVPIICSSILISQCFGFNTVCLPEIVHRSISENTLRNPSLLSMEGNQGEARLGSFTKPIAMAILILFFISAAYRFVSSINCRFVQVQEE